jgi:hypothetical protein
VETTNGQRHPLPRLAASATRAEQFSIWAMRLWSGHFPELDAAWPDFVRGFRVCGVQSAIEACHRFCSVALAAAGCSCGIACPCCASITPLEEKLLEALAVASRGDLDAAEEYLRKVMPASAARLAIPHAARFAQALARAGLDWPTAPAIDEDVYERVDYSVASVSSRRLH